MKQKTIKPKRGRPVIADGMRNLPITVRIDPDDLPAILAMPPAQRGAVLTRAAVEMVKGATIEHVQNQTIVWRRHSFFKE